MTGEPRLPIYDGNDRIGMVVNRGARCDAFDVSGVYLGSFKNVKAAISAVNVPLSCSCVDDASSRRDGTE